MPLPIEDYALIGDCRTAALVGRDGSIDWLCLPRFDSGACFAALLGDPGHGRWRIAPEDETPAASRAYRDGSLVLESEFATPAGRVRLSDCMARGDGPPAVVRIVEGLEGRVPMRMDLTIRFDYGSVVPWVRRVDGVLQAIAGPDTLELYTSVETHGQDLSTVATFTVDQGQRVAFVLRHRRSHEEPGPPPDAEAALAATLAWWREWSGRCSYRGRWGDAVQRSLITLKALTYAPTGGIVAAVTTSLPEQPGGTRNWDYRYAWLRDATFTLNVLLLAGYHEEAAAWREWLLRAAAGRPEDLQTLYGLAGERRIDEYEVDWLPGYGGARPVRVGNAASRQFQLDVYGEVMDTLHLARAGGLPPDPDDWNIQIVLLEFLEAHWRDPDEGIWEIRGPRRHFTHSKMMAWVAFDRAVKDMETFHLDGPLERWREVRDTIHADVCEHGFHAPSGVFTQSYGSTHLDASLLLMPLVGFLPPADPRVRATIAAIEDRLVKDGLVQRYATQAGVDGLPPGEGTFLPCSFWLADCLVLTGRRDEAEALFERLLALRNDVGLLSEEYDTAAGRLLGNFPQALSHMALIHTAQVLSVPEERAVRASQQGERPAAATQSPG